jgi:SAM-dependent methyltransferase
LWDSFWAEHASSERLFHRLLWRIRFLFSRAYAQRMLDTPRRTAPARIVEVGCGSARTLHYLSLALPGSGCFALDLSPEALHIVRQISPGFRPAVADAARLPLAEQSVSVAFSIGLIEHFDRDTAAAMVRDMARVTEPEGLVAVMVPWRSSFYNLVRMAFGRRWPFGQENPFRRGELKGFMAAQGLEEVRIHVIYGSTLLAVGRKLAAMSTPRPRARPAAENRRA